MNYYIYDDSINAIYIFSSKTLASIYHKEKFISETEYHTLLLQKPNIEIISYI